MTHSDWLSIFIGFLLRRENLIAHSKLRALCLGCFLCHTHCRDNSTNRYRLIMEVDESINNDESQQRNAYGSLIHPEEHDNSEASEVGDNSTCRTFIHCRIRCRNICLCCYLSIERNIFIFFYRVSFRT